LIRTLLLLLGAIVAVDVAVAIYWNATTFCADCSGYTYDLDNVVRLAGEEGAAAGGLFLLGGLLGVFLGRRMKEAGNG
jgi:hypothetical protein